MSLSNMSWLQVGIIAGGVAAACAAIYVVDRQRAAGKEKKADAKEVVKPKLEMAKASEAALAAHPAKHGAALRSAAPSAAAAGAALGGEQDYDKLTAEQQSAIQFCLQLQYQAQAKMEERKFAEALKLFELATEILKRGLGNDHMMVSEALYELASLAPALGDVHGGVTHHTEAHRIRVVNLGANHSMVGESHIKLAQMLHEMGADERANSEIAAARAILSMGDPSQPETRINVASADIIGAEISAALERFDAALEQASAAKAVFNELMPKSILSGHAAAVTASILRDSQSWDRAVAEYKAAIADSNTDELASVMYKLKNDLLACYMDMGNEAAAAEAIAELQSAPLIAAPLTSSRLLVTRFAALDPMADSPNMVQYVVVLMPRSHQWRRSNPEGKDAFVDIVMEAPCADRTPLTQTAMATNASILDSRAKIVVSSQHYPDAVYGIYKVVVKVFLDEARTQLIGTHVQMVAFKAPQPEDDAHHAEAGSADAHALEELEH